MILIFIIPIYILLNAYILHRIHKWLTACSERFHSKWFVVPYLTIYSLLALSLLFAFLLPASEFQVLVKRISNYWLGTFLYLLMFIAVADILRLILKPAMYLLDFCLPHLSAVSVLMEFYIPNT